MRVCAWLAAAFLMLLVPDALQGQAPQKGKEQTARSQSRDIAFRYLREWGDEQQAMGKAWQATKASEAQIRRESDAHREKWTKRFFELAEKYPEEPLLVTLLSNLAGQYSSEPEPPKEVYRVLEFLATHHLKDDKLTHICHHLEGWPTTVEIERFLKSLVNENPSKTVQALARLVLAEGYRRHINNPRTTEAARGGYRRETERLLSEIVEKYADVEDRGRVYRILNASKTEYSSKIGPFAEGRLYELQSLAPGKPAPEFEGSNVRGERVKLSDFRGKIVVLTFWFVGCEPCREMLPQERSLVAKLPAEHFAMVGVSLDDDKAELEQFLEKEKITWPIVWAKGWVGPIVQKYNIRSCPTIYVLDQRGMIRFKNVRGKALDDAVDELMREMQANKGK